MRLSRRMALLKPIEAGLSYTGTYSQEGDSSEGQIILLTSGTLTLASGTYDVWGIGGGGSGGKGYYSDSEDMIQGGGGGSGKTFLVSGLTLSGAYTVTIGAGGTNANGGDTTFVVGLTTYKGDGGLKGADGVSMAGHPSNGGNGGSGGSSGSYSGVVGGSNGSNGGGSYPGTGQGTTTKAFAESGNVLYGGGGAGGKASGSNADRSAGGGGGTGSTLRDALANTGSGGGGGDASSTSSKRIAGTGGAGLVIVRWGGYIPS